MIPTTRSATPSGRVGNAARPYAPSSRNAAPTTAATPTPAPAPQLATGLRDQVTGTAVQNGTTVEVNLTDRRDANLRITVAVRGNSTTGQLLITDNGATVCNTTASVAQDLLATCGRTSVDISLAQQADGSIAGQMVTAAGQ